MGYIAAVFGAGLLSFFSPCVLPLLPVYVAYLTTDAQAEGSPFAQKLARTLAFVAGISVVFFALGLSAGALGGLFSNPYFGVACGLVVFLFGLYYADLLHIPWLDRQLSVQLPSSFNTRSVVGAFILGLVFSFGWTPCIGPVLASVLALAAEQGSAAAGGGLLLVYSLGLCIPFFVVALGADALLSRVRAINTHLPTIKKIGGYVIAVVGIIMILAQVSAPLQASEDAAVEPSASASAAAQAQSALVEDGGDDFVLTDLEGNAVKLSDYRGRPVYLHFWGTWCPPCMAGLPNLRQLAADYNASGDAQVLTVVLPSLNGEYSETRFIAWAEANDIDFPVLFDRGGGLAQAYGISAFPTTIYYDSEGHIVRTSVGDLPDDQVRAILDELAGND